MTDFEKRATEHLEKRKTDLKVKLFKATARVIIAVGMNVGLFFICKEWYDIRLWVIFLFYSMMNSVFKPGSKL